MILKINASRLMRKSTAGVLISLTLLNGCARVITDCPKPVAIAAEIQAEAANELAALPADSAIGKVMSAAQDDRDKLRACRKITR